MEHGVEDGDYPVFEGAVVAVGDYEVADSVHTFGSKTGSRRGEGSEVGVSEAFDEVFFHSAGRGDDGGDMVMLNEVAECFTKSGRDQIGRVAEEYGGLRSCFWISPCSLFE